MTFSAKTETLSAKTEKFSEKLRNSQHKLGKDWKDFQSCLKHQHAPRTSIFTIYFLQQQEKVGFLLANY
jgi:hypothetical protein